MADLTEEQLIGALRKADAAGDAPAAQAIARRIQSMRQSPAATEQAQPTLEQRYAAAGIDPNEGDPIAGTTRMDRFLAGAGRSVAETYRGLKQVGGAAVDAIPGVDASDFRRRTQEEIDEARRTDAPLMDTGWGIAGNVAGTIGQLYTPGAALKGVTLGRAFLPTTIAGNAAQGAVLGGLQPTTTGESRATNALAGGLAGAAGTGLVQAAGAALRGARNALAGSGLSGVDRAAAQQIAAEAANPQALMTAQPSGIPGVQRTLAEETRDEGLARLEQTLRGQPGYNWGARDSGNNIARTNVLESIAGTDADMAVAEAARAANAGTARAMAMTAGDVDISRTLAQLDDAIAGAQGRPAVQAGLRQLRGLLSSDVERAPGLVTNEPVSRIDVLDNVRKTIGDMLGGKYGGDNAAALAGSRELIAIRDSLNDEIGQQVPAFTAYLNAYRQGSGPINRMEVGRELLRRGTQNIQTDAAGNRMLAPKPVANAVRDLDAIAQRATGFAKAKASDILKSGDIAMLKALQDDAERQVFARTAGTGGNSASASRAGVLARMGARAGDAVAGVLPYGAQAKSFLQLLDEKGTERINERMAYLVANPDEARRVLAALPPAGQRIVSRALAQLGGAGAAGLGVTAATQDQPLEIDISGGVRGDAPTPEQLEALRSQMRANAASAY